MESEIRPMQAQDWHEVARIYQEGMDTGLATLETEVPSWEVFDKSHLKIGRVVAESNGRILAWGALSPVSNRCVYGGVAETSVYVGSEARGNGIGKKVLATLISDSEKHGIWSLLAGIFPENKTSCKLHESLGFRLVGINEKISKLAEKWMDVARYEKRSKKTGI